MGWTKRSTGVRRNTSSPDWAEAFEFELDGGEGGLEITVLDRDIRRRDEVIGRVHIPALTLVEVRV